MENTNFTFTENEMAMFGEHSIGALILFGSRAQNLSSLGSDFDIGVIVEDQKILLDQSRRIKVYNILYDIFSKHINQLVNIDIVFLETVPAELQAHVMKYGQVLFENKDGIFADFRARVIEQYADFAPLRAIFHSGILSQMNNRAASSAVSSARLQQKRLFTEHSVLLNKRLFDIFQSFCKN